MIHRHSSVASRPRNARGMLGTVSSPIAKRAAEAPRADAPGARHQKGAQSLLPYRGAGHTALPPVCSAARRSLEQTECLLCVCVCVCACVRACVCVCACVLVDQAHTKKVEKAFSFVV